MTPQEQLTAALDCLQSALKADPAAMNTLLSIRVSCNDALANHPTIRVGIYKTCTGNRVSFLGVLNGILRSMELPELTAEFTWGEGDRGYIPELQSFALHQTSE